MRINFTGHTANISDGLSILAKELHFEQSEDGYIIQLIEREGPIRVKNENGKGEIYFQEKIHFFRGLGLWIENYIRHGDFERIEKPQFHTNGAMLDASRNAVLTVENIQGLLRKMAVMGLNVLMVYTEDTYEVKEYPYFGYMRGKYTESELKICDLYAAALGIEMIPCIQTLAHLTEALKWNYAAPIRDTADILLVDEPETYRFLEKIIEAASRPFQTRRIHIGMDEAHQLGLGKYLDKNGYVERFQLMNRHLNSVIEITEKLSLKPMIWSDMYFRLGSKERDYYDLNVEIPAEVVDSIPNVQLVYWDYYHTEEDFYHTFIQKHKELGSDPIFAGGAWTWNGISPNYGKAMVTTEAALNACKKTGIKEIFATMWGDNGAETPLMTSLPILQLYAEHSYYEQVSPDHLEQRFRFCTGGNFTDFMMLNQFDETPGVEKNNLHESNPSKLLLWQDPLIGLYDKNIRGLNMQEHYKQLSYELAITKYEQVELQCMFDFYKQLADVLSLKAEMGIHLQKAYEAKDKEKMQILWSELAEVKKSVSKLRVSHRKLWFMMNKPFGWEVIDIRYGGILARIETTQHRLSQWIDGLIDKIEELEEKRLYFEGPYVMPKGTIGRNLYHRIVTAGSLI
ncbi:beta-N-acetylhexosaminidase [Bacillus sp. FJAT-50079]|uniref:beta-N-acetylhexosaminidase n=1 Tax=Bacillus sp. FJAT-50079 TaxID=2833577 RepID=UPI001BC94C21|nr:beta-N-acetylhexosaminidase [Bacillus sp. FJAT-50079]MBS4207921.1 beta-N-acetylhexosaminidase [Bacillus sp. FJAT-50079]